MRSWPVPRLAGGIAFLLGSWLSDPESVKYPLGLHDLGRGDHAVLGLIGSDTAKAGFDPCLPRRRLRQPPRQAHLRGTSRRLGGVVGLF